MQDIWENLEGLSGLWRSLNEYSVNWAGSLSLNSPYVLPVLKGAFLLLVVLLIIKVIARKIGIPKKMSLAAMSVQRITAGQSGLEGPDVAGNYLRVSRNFLQNIPGIDPRAFHEKTADITFTYAGNVNTEKTGGQPLTHNAFATLSVQRINNFQEIGVNDALYNFLDEVIRGNLPPGNPVKRWNIEIKPTPTNLRFLLNRHPDRNVRLTVLVTLMTSLFAIITVLVSEFKP